MGLAIRWVLTFASLHIPSPPQPLMSALISGSFGTNQRILELVIRTSLGWEKNRRNGRQGGCDSLSAGRWKLFSMTADSGLESQDQAAITQIPEIISPRTQGCTASTSHTYLQVLLLCSPRLLSLAKVCLLHICVPTSRAPWHKSFCSVAPTGIC